MIPALVVTAADAGYYPLLDGLLGSLDRCCGSARPPLAVLDLGLTPEQQASLAARDVRLVEPAMPDALPNVDGTPRTYLAQLCRPYLPDLFPDADVLIWLDADIWVQDGQLLHWLQAGAAAGDLVIAPELHTSYWRHYTHSGQYAKYVFYEKYFGGADAELHGFTPTLNVGVFALHRAAPHWQVWQRTMKRVLRHEAVFCAEQLALDHAVLTQNLACRWLPAVANWMCHQARPLWSHQQRLFLEPQVPHRPLWALHLVMSTKAMGLEIQAIDGPPITTRLTFDAVRGLLDG